MKHCLIFTVIVAACLQAALVFAAEETEKAHSIEPVTVSARHQEEPKNSPYRLPASSLASTWSIGQKEIQALQPRDLFDVLSYAPGVQLSYQGRKAMNFLGGRGGGNFIGGTNYAVMVDGIYLPWTHSARMLANFPVETIESVRIVRDSTILTLGPLAGLGAIGPAVQGVVMIKTIKPERRESQVKASYGNLDRYKAFLSHGDRIVGGDGSGEGYYSLNFSKRHDGGRDDWNNASDSNSILLKGGYALHGLTADVSIYHDWATREIQRSTSVSKTSDAKWEYDPMDSLMVSANLAKAWNASQTTSLGLYTGRLDADLQMRSWSKPTLSTQHVEDNATQADLRHIITSAGNILRMGTQAIWWRVPNGQLYYEGIAREEELYSAYLHDEYNLTQSITVDAGARIDRKHVSKGINKYAPTDNTPTVLIDDEWAEPYYTAAVGAAYRLNNKWRLSLRASYVEQSADNYLLSANNKTLAPEKQWRYEAGVEASLHPAFNAVMTLFHYDISNCKTVVGSVTVDDDIYNVYDTMDVARQGVEFDINGFLGTPNLTYSLAYSYQTSDNETDNEAIPRHIASLRLGYSMMPFQVNLLLRHVSDYRSNQFSVGNLYYDIGGYSRVDANISYLFKLGSAQMKATLFGQNLSDERYETRLGWEDVGLTFGVELGAKF
jgi:outer membrane cobalamin receptor